MLEVRDDLACGDSNASMQTAGCLTRSIQLPLLRAAGAGAEHGNKGKAVLYPSQTMKLSLAAGASCSELCSQAC